MLVGLDLCSAGRRTEAWGPIPTSGQRSQRRRFKDGSETADLGQPKWDENQTVLAAAVPTRTGTQVSWREQQLGARV